MKTTPLARLAPLGRKNFNLLEQVVQGFKSGLLEDAHSKNHDAFMNEYERYRVWAIESGLLVPGHGSLDYRLRESETLTELFEVILNGLAQNLEETLELGRPQKGGEGHSRERPDIAGPRSDDQAWFENENDDDDDDDLEPQSYIDILLEVIVGFVNRLFKLSTKIRNPSTRLGLSRARYFESIDEATGVDLIKAFAHYDDDYVRSIFLQYRLKAPEQNRAQERQELASATATENSWHQTEACELCQSQGSVPEGSIISDGDRLYDGLDEDEQSDEDKRQLQDQIGAHYLMHRIARANNQRRQQFGYWKKHYSKLQKHTEIALQTPRPRLLVEHERHHESVPVEQQEQHLNVRSARSLFLSLLAPPTVTTATRLEPSLLNRIDERSVTSVSEYAPSSWAPDRDNIGFPPPPKKPVGEKFFECPYCFTTCPAQMLSDKAWRAHLIHDLRPFICTYPDCQSAGQLYDTRAAWVEHENTIHRRQWRCPEHPDSLHSSLQSFEAHVNALHGSDATYLLSNTFVQACQLSSPDCDRPCPICLSSSFRNVKGLQSHVSRHLIRMSLFSLPRSTDADDGRSQVGSDIAVGEVLDSRADDDEISSEGGEAWDDVAEAARSGDIERLTNILREKQEDGIDVEVLNYALCKASERGHADIADLLLDIGADIEASDRDLTPLMEASTLKNNIEVVRLLLHRGADVNGGRGYDTPLTFAAGNGYIEVVRELLAAGADPNKMMNDGYSAARAAAAEGRLDFLKLLMEHGANINVPTSPALPIAASMGHKEVFEHLLASGADMEARDVNSYTALMGASGGGHQEISEELLRRGADPSAVDEDGNTALMLVSGMRGEQVEIAKMLIDSGADVNHANTAGDTALHVAAARGYTSMAKVLIDAGADLEKPNQKTNTPLQAALKARKYEVVDTLLEAGAIGKPPPDPMDEVILPQPGAMPSRKSPPRLPRHWSIDTPPSSEKAPRLTLVHDIAMSSILTGVRFSPDGRYLAVAGQAVAWLVDLDDVSKMFELPHSGSDHADLYVRSICFSSDGKSLATAFEDDIVRLWDVDNLKLKHVFEHYCQELLSVAISPDNNMIVSGFIDGSIFIDDCATGESIRTLRIQGSVTSLSFSPDSRLLAAGTGSNKVFICKDLGDEKRYKLLEVTPSPTEAVYDVAFSSSRERVYLYCASLDNIIYRLLFKYEGEYELTGWSKGLHGHEDYALTVAQTGDYRWIVSGSRDKTFRIWSDEIGEAVAVVKGHKDTVISVATCPGRNLIATASGDMTFTVWRYEDE
ncbi:general transcription repressor [Knufia peltigerae]|uniref:General transcription repressor n=1 Tax=Knufia peltigerae TaxID=1002370 RepID=A0AA38Y7F4_9EURO|nr:general transcription repressor [Knufia peltigerae]